MDWKDFIGLIGFILLFTSATGLIGGYFFALSVKMFPIALFAGAAIGSFAFWLVREMLTASKALNEYDEYDEYEE
jgi:hypothetical protein